MANCELIQLRKQLKNLAKRERRLDRKREEQRINSIGSAEHFSKYSNDNNSNEGEEFSTFGTSRADTFAGLLLVRDCVLKTFFSGLSLKIIFSIFFFRSRPHLEA